MTPQEYDYILIVDLDPGLRAKCLCADTTLINWLKRYDVSVNGKLEPLGLKVGSQWRVSPRLLEQFLMGRGVPKVEGTRR